MTRGTPSDTGEGAHGVRAERQERPSGEKRLRERALERGAADLHDSRDATDGQTQWAAEASVDRHRFDLPQGKHRLKESTDGLMRDAVDDDRDAGRELLRGTKECPND